MRGYNYRRNQENKKIKKRILQEPYAHGWRDHWLYGHGRRSRRYFGRTYIEVNWINFIGEYSGKYKKQNTVDTYNRWRWEKKPLWKDKYQVKRSKRKQFILNQIKDQVGEEYYILNK